MRRILAAAAAALTASVLTASQPAPPVDPADPHPLAALRAEAGSLRPLAASDLSRRMLDEVADLPVIPPRTLHVAVRPNRAVRAEDLDELPEPERAGLRPFEVTPARYYATFYGTPLVYARLLDLAAEVWGEGATLEGKRVLDLGYGQLGQLRLWAQMGAAVTGIEMDPILTAMYTDNPAAAGEGAKGSLRLLECVWPNDALCREQVGGGYDLFVSRNLLKKGYVKPERPTPGFPEPVGWGTDDAEVLGNLFEVMAPGGLVIVYSLGPAPDPAQPWSDIANPWPREAWAAAGFEVLAYDADETAWARTMGRALGWEAQMDLEKAVFGVYSIFRRPEQRR